MKKKYLINRLSGVIIIFFLIGTGQNLFSQEQDTDYTHLIVNNDFELAYDANCDPVTVTPDMDGWLNNAWRPTISSCAIHQFYGWTWSLGFKDEGGNNVMGNNSQGLNKDFNNMNGEYGCWIGGNLILPELVELYQVINGLPAGTYKVQCRLGVGNNKKTSQRLFANQDVQYHGLESQYISNLTAGEIATFAGWEGTTEKNLEEMVVYTVIEAGDSLKLGIRTGGINSDGNVVAQANPFHGWFKVDYFRLTKLGEANAVDKNLSDAVNICVQDCKLRVTGVDAYMVYNLNGIKVADIHANAANVSVDLHPGVYIVKTKTGKVAKVLVQ